MAPSALYTPDERSKGVRWAKRTEHDADRIRSMINECQILHGSFNAPAKDGAPQFPTILPMLGALDTYGDDQGPSVYLHGSSAARLFTLTRGGEMPICVAGTLFDGDVLALAPFHNSSNYRSAVVFGHGSLVQDAEEVQFALRLITNNTIPERWENGRKPPTAAEVASTGVLEVRMEAASAKTRAGGPSDEKFDLQNPDVVDHTWVGVVPTYTVFGGPIAGEENKVKPVPEYLADWVADRNSMSEQVAIDAVEGDGDCGGPQKRN